MRLIAAFALAPLAPVLLALAIMPYRLTLYLGLLLAYATEIVIGIPLYFLVRRFGPLAEMACVLGGAAAGAALWVALMIPVLVRNGWQALGTFVAGALFYGAFGAVAGFAFWKIVWRSPR